MLRSFRIAPAAKVEAVTLLDLLDDWFLTVTLPAMATMSLKMRDIFTEGTRLGIERRMGIWLKAII